MTPGLGIRTIASALLLALAACTSSSNGSKSSGSCIDNTSTLSVDNESQLDATITVGNSNPEAQTFLAPSGKTTQVTVPAGGAIIYAWPVGDPTAPFQTENFQFVCGELHHFSLGPHPDVLVVAELEGTGFGDVKSDPPGVDCSTDRSHDKCSAFFPFGTALAITSVADDDSSSSDGTQHFVLTGNQQVVGSFNSQGRASIAITVNGNGFGSVRTIPYDLDHACGPGATSCGQFFEDGTDVTVIAEPTAGSIFNGFTGDCSGAACTIHVDNNSPANIGVVFTLEKETLTASIIGSGMGDLTSIPEGLICNSSVANACSGEFDYGTQVTIESLPAAGSKLAAWGGACAGTDPSAYCSVNVFDAMNATADFEPQ